jgi:hypothetical protein
MEMTSAANDMYSQAISVTTIFALTFLGPQAIPMFVMASFTAAALLTGIY